jgi:hypothetical protein
MEKLLYLNFFIILRLFGKFMIFSKSQDKILKEYEQKSEVILKKMMYVLVRAQRKVDDEAYRTTLAKLENIHHSHKK